jgi:tocopherol O-methyltransferase
MHHGYYPTPDYPDHKLAQYDMIDRTLFWAYGNDLIKDDFKEPKTMVDVGCGVGGSSRHISRKWGTSGVGKL